MTLLSRIAQAEASSHTRFAAQGQVARFGPLTAVHTGPNLPLDTAWHDGSGTPTPDDLAGFEDFSAGHGQAATLHVLSPFAPELLPVLRERGYALDYVLHLYVHDLKALPVAPGLPVTELPVTEEPDAGRWAELSAQGFGPGTLEIMRVVGGAPGTRRFTAWLDGQPAATGAFALQDGVAALHGTSTRPEFRGRGAQAALLAHRLQASAQAGADLATVFVTPDTASERNICRAGFRLSGLRLTFTRA